MSSRSFSVRAIVPRLLPFVIAPLILAASASAHAAAPTSDAASAEALFTKGKEAMASGDFATACANLSESLKIDPAVGTRLNLATCEEKSGKPSAALRDFLAAQAQLSKDDFRVAFTAERIAILTQHVAHITLTASSVPPAGTRVLRDGAEVSSAAWNIRVPVDPGPHVIVVERPGKSSFRAELTLAEREDKVLDLAEEAARLRPAPTEAAAALPEQDVTTGGGRRTLAYVVTGAGVAGLVVGTVAGILTIAAASNYKDYCSNGVCNAAGLDAASRGKTMSIVSPVALGLGAVATGVGIYLFATSTPARAATPRAIVAPSASPSFGGISLTGTF